MPEFREACEFAKLKFKDAQVIERPVRFYPDDVIVQFLPTCLPTYYQNSATYADFSG